MAGIIVDLSDDIRKLQSLKEEIANVKKELSSINVNVKIDIAQGLEQRLQSLMGEYNALGRKIAENDAKITVSAQNIIKTAETITQAQEKLAGASNAVSSVGNTNGYAANIAGQAKSYGELKERIEAVNGTREQLVERIVGEMNEIRLLNAEIKNINKIQTENGELTKGQKEKLVQLNSELLTHKTALSDARIALNNYAKLDNAVPTSMNALSQSLSKMRSVYRELSEEERNSPFGKDLLASIQQADEKIKELDASIGNHQRNVGNYISAFEGLKDIKDAGILTEKFKEASIAIEETQRSIQNLSKASSEYAAKGKEIRNEVSNLSAALRLGMSEGISSEQQTQTLDYLKTKVQEYGTVMTEASAAAQAAYNLQQESVKSLEAELANLQIALQNALAEGNTASADVLSQRIIQVNAQLSRERGELSNLGQAADKAKEALNAVVEEQAKMSQNVGRGDSFFGNLIDGINLLKEKSKDFLAPATEQISAFVENAKTKLNSVGQSVSDTFSNISQKIGFDRLGDAFSSAGSKISEYKSKVIDAATGNGKFQESLSLFKDNLNKLPIPLGKSIDGIVGMTKAMWAMVATPVGAVLTAIVLALQALFQWFTKSAEGQRVYAQLTAYLGSLLSSLTDIVVIIGSYLFHAFADANGPMNNFAKGLKTTFVSAVKTVGELVRGLGNTLKGIFTTDWETFKTGLSEMATGLKNAGKTMLLAVDTSIKGTIGLIKTAYNAVTDEKLGSDLSKAFDSMLPKASQASNLAIRQLNAQIALGKATEKAAALEREIAEKRENIYRLTGKAKDAAIEEVKALEKAKFDDQIKAQKEMLEIQKERNAAHTSSLEDLKKERDLHISVLRTQAQQAASTRMLVRMQESNRRKMETSARSAQKKEEAAAKKQLNKDNSITSADIKWADVVNKNADERAKALVDIEEKATEARINAMKEGAEKVRAEREHENRKELDQLAEQQQAAIDAEVKRQKEEFEAEQAKVKAKGGRIQKWDDSMLDNSFIEEIKKKYKEIQRDTIKKQNKEVYDAEIQSMRDYLKEYGSFQQQKLAIAEEYDEKIEKALTEGDKKKLKKEKEKALSGLSFENISMGIDWSALLGGVANLSTEMLKPMLGQLEAYTKTQEFNDADIQEREKVVELIKELRQYVGTDQNTTWKDLAAAITNFTAAVAAYKEAEKNEKVAVAARDEAKGKYERGEISKEEFDKFDKAAQELGEKTVAARDEMKGLGNTLNETTEDLKTQGNKLQSAINKAATTWEGVEGFSELKGSAEGFSQLKGTLDTSLATMKSGLGKDIGVGVSDALGGITDGLTSAFDFMSNGVMGVVGIVAQIPKLILNMADNIKNFVTGILDSFTELLKFEWIEDLVNSILDSVGNLIDAIFDLPENLFHVLESIVVNGVGGLVNGVFGRVGNVLSLGALSSKGPAEWFSGSNAEEVAKTINRLTERNESLQKAIEDLTDEISNSTGAEAISASKQAIEYQKEYNRNILGKAQAQMDYSGNHHSWGYYFGGFSPELVDWIKKNVKQNYNNNNQENELLNLTPEEMKKLLSNVDIRDYIEDTGKSYYGESVLEFLDEYAEQAGKVQDIIDSLNESLTQVSFDSLRDSFVDSLMDMDKSAQDFADDFSEYMMRAVLNARVDEMLGDELQAFYDKWAEYSTDKSGENYELTEDEINKLQKDWDNIVQRGVDLRDQVAAITGYGSKKTTEQSATAKSIESITADQADQLIGRVTAVQIGVENGNTKREQEVATVNILNANLAQLVAANKEQINRFDGISDILAQSYLVQQDIRDNTGNAAKALRTMQGDLSDIKNEIRRL